MRACLPAFPIVFASPATAEAIDGGRSCTAVAFSTVGGLHGEGRGTVTLRVGADYRPTAASFTYGVFDRVTGRMKMEATWSLPSKALDASSAMTSFRIPLSVTTGDEPFGVGVTLDGKLVASALSSRPGGVIHFDSDGRRFAQAGKFVIASGSASGWMPDLRTAKLLAYSALGTGNKPLGGELFLLPEWAKAAKAVRAAMTAAERLRRKKQCATTFLLK